MRCWFLLFNGGVQIQLKISDNQCFCRCCFIFQLILQRGSIAKSFSRGSLPVFLWRPIEVELP